MNTQNAVLLIEYLGPFLLIAFFIGIIIGGIAVAHIVNKA